MQEVALTVNKMTEGNQQFERNHNAWETRAMVTTVVCVFGAQIASHMSRVPQIAALFLIFFVINLIGYWIPPRPPIRYRYFVLKLIAYPILIYVGLWTAPALLSRLIWEPLAYGISALVMALAIYWLPPLYPIRNQTRLWVWAIFSIAFAIACGFLGSRFK